MNQRIPMSARLYDRTNGPAPRHLLNMMKRAGERLNIPVPMYDMHQSRMIADWLKANVLDQTIDDISYQLTQEYKNNGGKAFKRGRPPGSKNRNNNYQGETNALDSLPRDETEYNALNTLQEELQEATAEQAGGDLSKYVLNTKFDAFAFKVSDKFAEQETAINGVSYALTNLADKVANIVDNRPTIVELKRPELPNLEMGEQHKNFPKLLMLCSAALRSGHRLNVWIYGPAGTGKSTAGEKTAEALNLPFYSNGKLKDDFQVLGYKDASGVYHTTQFREAFEKGGIYLADEIDGSLPDALLAFNGALANGHCAFPDKLVKRHKDFIFLGAANTTGKGGTIEYVARYKQDAAFADRFVMLDWPLDIALEDSLVANKDWLQRVRYVRARLMSSGLKDHLITPRASIFGEALLAAGLTQDEVEASVLRKGLSDAQWGMIS